MVKPAVKKPNASEVVVHSSRKKIQNKPTSSDVITEKVKFDANNFFSF